MSKELIDKATRDICSISFNPAPKSKVREILEELVEQQKKEIVETLTKKAMPPENFGYGDENRTVNLMEINNLNNI